MTDLVHGIFPVLKPPLVDAAGPAPRKPNVPAQFSATALLHPFSPPPDSGDSGTPFFELCAASVAYAEGTAMSVCLRGFSSGASWWYYITPDGVSLSRDQGKSWSPDTIGWRLPDTDWLGPDAVWFQTGPINWMGAQTCQWWKQPVPGSRATTWTWFDDATQMPFRMMFGAPPPTPTSADPAQLAVFQNFSFTYFPAFARDLDPVLDQWVEPDIHGLTPGNRSGWKLPVWNNCFAMSTLMTPVDSASFPLPTVVLYQWKPDGLYREAADRCQATIMSYQYNPRAGFSDQVAQLYGVAPSGDTPPKLSGTGWLFDELIILVRGAPEPIVLSCDQIPLGQQPPDWARIPAVDGTIHATVSDNPALSPGQTTNIISVVFPPSKEYPQGRYLWTWYSPLPGSDGTRARPVTFMESASTISEGGTSLALADYFDYFPQSHWFPAEYFALPDRCTASGDRRAPGGTGLTAETGYGPVSTEAKA